jgi:dienelactone hydrolase/uncharacterized protein YndB with AHSA1/START domain
MKLIKSVLIVLAAIVVLLTVVGFLLPARTQVERSVEISAQPETVFRLLNDLRVFNQWSPWAKIDPQTEYSYSGSETGVGSVMRWSSEHPHVGKGEQKIVSSEPNNEIRLILTMQGMKPFQAGYLLEPVDSEGTRLTWTYETDNGLNLFYRYLGALAMDRMLGSMFEQGLADFKEIAESQPEPAPAQISSQVIPYEVDGVVYTGYLAYDPAVESSPGILVVHEWWGHNDYARKRADMLAQLGYTAFALDMYGEGKQAAHPDDAMKFVQQAMSDPEGVVAKFNAALEVLKEHGRTDPEQLAAIGYCFGGGVVLNMARNGADLDAVVSFHGSLQASFPIADDVDTRVLVLNGADDPFVTAEQKDAFKKEMDAAGIHYEFIDYPGAVHAFTNPAADELGQKFNMPLAYNAEADQASWQKMQEWFKSVFGN